MPSTESYDTIILFDSSSRLEEIKESIEKKKSIIITFDYESHKILSQQNITHEISDNYLTKNDLDDIQKHSYNFSRWYADSTIANLLEYEGINLGELFYIEFQHILVPFLKEFVEMMKIHQVYGKAGFVVSPQLYEIINSFTKLTSKLNDKKTSDLLSYQIEIPIKIGKKVFPLHIKPSHLSKLRGIFEKIIIYLFGPQKRLQDNKATVLLLDFTTLRHRTMFSLSPNFSLSLIKYDRNIPPIWNFESYLIMKNSNCIIVNYSTLMDKNMKNSIKNGMPVVELKIDSLLNHENYFKSFFSINGISFWKIIKPTFIELYKKQLHSVIQEIELAKKLFKKYNITSVLTWSEGDYIAQIIIKLAKKLNIPTILIQHGLYHDSPERLEYNKFLRVLPIYSDKFIVWGKMLEDYSKNYGIVASKIETLGSPFFDDIFNENKKNLEHQNEFILLATSSPLNYWAPDLTVKVRSDYEMAIKRICQIVTKMNKKLVIKLHPSQDFGEDEIAREIDPRITVIKGGTILSLIQSCEALITIDVSTSILEAQILGKPVISITVKDHGNDEVFSSKSCVRTDIDSIEDNLKRLLSDQDFKEELIKNGHRFVESYLVNRGNASENILKFLEKFQ